jgi:hypothetical protein
MTDKVAPLFGGLKYQPEVIESAVQTLEMALEAAKSGEIVGVAIAMLDCRGMGSYSIAGRIGGYSMIGALEMAKAEIIAVNWDDDE